MNEQLQDILIGTGVLVIILSSLALYAYCIIDIHKQRVKYVSQKATWLNIIWLAPVLGCIIYLMNRRRIWKGTNSSF